MMELLTKAGLLLMIAGFLLAATAWNRKSAFDRVMTRGKLTKAMVAGWIAEPDSAGGKKGRVWIEYRNQNGFLFRRAADYLQDGEKLEIGKEVDLRYHHGKSGEDSALLSEKPDPNDMKLVRLGLVLVLLGLLLSAKAWQNLF